LKSHRMDGAPHSLEALEDEICTWEGEFSTWKRLGTMKRRWCHPPMPKRPSWEAWHHILMERLTCLEHLVVLWVWSLRYCFIWGRCGTSIALRPSLWMLFHCMCHLGEKFYGLMSHRLVILGHFVAYVGKKTNRFAN
jgi:hypothetical protein